MGYKVQFETGHTVEFDSMPSQKDIDEAFEQVKGVPIQNQLQSDEPSIADKLIGAGEAGLNTLTG